LLIKGIPSCENISVFIAKVNEIGADYFATGHYCRKEEININGKLVYRLLAGSDTNKDQSYFLCQLSQEQLKHALFPIGHLEKPEVREIAKKMDMASAEKKDSQGICFVGKVDLPTFLQQKLEAKTGDIIEIPKNKISNETEAAESLRSTSEKPQVLFAERDYQPSMGKVVGQHRGAHFFTIGQRKGLDVGGTREPLFIISTDIKKNIVYVGQGKNHPGLFRQGLFIPFEDVHWIRPDQQLNPGEEGKYFVRIRYRQVLQKATIYAKANGLNILFDQPQRGITSGQFAAWYKEDELLGSGVIA